MGPISYQIIIHVFKIQKIFLHIFYRKKRKKERNKGKDAEKTRKKNKKKKIASRSMAKNVLRLSNVHKIRAIQFFLGTRYFCIFVSHICSLGSFIAEVLCVCITSSLKAY